MVRGGGLEANAFLSILRWCWCFLYEELSGVAWQTQRALNTNDRLTRQVDRLTDPHARDASG